MEVRILHQLQLDSVVSVEDCFLWENRYWIVLEYMTGGPISDIIGEARGNYSEEFCKYTIWKVTKAVADLHELNVLHRDIKALNILVNADGEIKLADFGFSGLLSE